MVIHEQLGEERDGEAGYMLLAVVVMVALVLIALAVAMPSVVKDLRRDKEVESQHRAEQYVRAIQLFYRKNKGYPPSIKALEKTNNIRFLRQQYVDPLTGKADWKLIHQGEQKTKIHVFFGQELSTLSAGLGAAAAPGLASGQGGVTVNSSNALNAGFGGAAIGSSGATGASGASGASGATGSTGGFGSSSGTGMFGDSTGGIIVGVTTSRSGESITNPNQQTSFDTWEFWYDPRIELLKQAVSITGGGMASQSASSFGQGLNGQPNSGASGASGATGSTGLFGTPSGGVGPTAPSTPPIP